MRELPDPFTLAVLLLDAVLLLLFFERLLAALQASVVCFRSSYGTREFLGNNYLCASVRQTLVLLIPFYAIRPCSCCWHFSGCSAAVWWVG